MAWYPSVAVSHNARNLIIPSRALARSTARLLGTSRTSRTCRVNTKSQPNLSGLRIMSHATQADGPALRADRGTSHRVLNSMPRPRHTPQVVARSMHRAQVLYITAVMLVFAASTAGRTFISNDRFSAWHIGAVGLLVSGLATIFITHLVKLRRRWTAEALAASCLLCENCGHPLTCRDDEPSATCSECGASHLTAQTKRNWRSYIISLGEFTPAESRDRAA